MIDRRQSPLMGAELPAAAAFQIETKVPRILGLELLSGAPILAT